MYEYPKVTTSEDMKEDIQKMSAIKIKLVSNNIFSLNNLLLIGKYLNPTHLFITSIDIGVDRVIKLASYISIQEIITNYEIPQALRQWINSDTIRFTLFSILTDEEYHFLDLHFEMIYQIETFENCIYIRI